MHPVLTEFQFFLQDWANFPTNTVVLADTGSIKHITIDNQVTNARKVVYVAFENLDYARRAVEGSSFGM